MKHLVSRYEDFEFIIKLSTAAYVSPRIDVRTCVNCEVPFFRLPSVICHCSAFDSRYFLKNNAWLVDITKRNPYQNQSSRYFSNLVLVFHYAVLNAKILDISWRLQDQLFNLINFEIKVSLLVLRQVASQLVPVWVWTSTTLRKWRNFSKNFKTAKLIALRTPYSKTKGY